MTRLRHFIANAGVAGTVQTVVVLGGIVFALVFAVREGRILPFYPLAGAALFLSFCIRGFLVKHFDYTALLMNVCAAGLWISGFLLRSSFKADKLAFCALFFGMVLYISCYIGVLSDPRVRAT